MPLNPLPKFNDPLSRYDAAEPEDDWLNRSLDFIGSIPGRINQAFPAKYETWGEMLSPAAHAAEPMAPLVRDDPGTSGMAQLSELNRQSGIGMRKAPGITVPRMNPDEAPPAPERSPLRYKLGGGEWQDFESGAKPGEAYSSPSGGTASFFDMEDVAFKPPSYYEDLAREASAARMKALAADPFGAERAKAMGKMKGPRPVGTGDVGRLAEMDTALDDVKVLRNTVMGPGATGAAQKVGAMLPNAVTEFTGLGSDAKQRQATIDRVKQVIGKALEGGVLRKEDEYKYVKILPTIGDPPDVVQAKLSGLEEALTLRRARQLENLARAGYDVSGFTLEPGNLGLGSESAVSQDDIAAFAESLGIPFEEAIKMAEAEGYTVG